MDAPQGGELDIVENASDPPCGREGGDHLQHISHDGIAEVMHPCGAGQICGDLEITLDVAATAHLDGLSRGEQDVAERQHPRHALGTERRQPVLGQVDPDDLSVPRRHDREGVGDGVEFARLRRLDNARGRIEEHPDCVATPEAGGRGVLLEGEDDAHR